MWLRLSHVSISPFVIFHVICIAYAPPRFACPCARISRHFIFCHRHPMSVAEALSCWFKPICHFHICIASVCVPVCTYFEALHFHICIASVCVPVGTHFEAHRHLAFCITFPHHRHFSCIFSVCAPVGTHFEASHFHSIVYVRIVS